MKRAVTLAQMTKRMETPQRREEKIRVEKRRKSARSRARKKARGSEDRPSRMPLFGNG